MDLNRGVYICALMNTADIPPMPFSLKGRHWEAVISYVSELQKTNLRVKDDLYLA